MKSSLTNAGVLYRVNIEPITLSLRKARKSARDTPPCSARTVISAMHCETTPSMRLWQIFTNLARSPSPTYVTARAMSSRWGCASSHASAGPETQMVTRPALTTFGLPDTGAASSATPSSAAAARTSSPTAGETVVLSTTSRGRRSPDRMPCGPSRISLKSFGPATIVKTMSRSPSSAGASTIVAPSSASGSALARVRL